MENKIQFKDKLKSTASKSDITIREFDISFFRNSVEFYACCFFIKINKSPLHPIISQISANQEYQKLQK